MSLTFFSGGTGTPKLLEGTRKIYDEKKLTIICNTGDDFSWNSLYVSPDLDTVLYLFAEMLDLKKYWGRNNETFNSLQTLGTLGFSTWFQVGDRDLGLHIFRSHLINKGYRLTEIAKMVSRAWGIEATILPMSDDQVTTRVVTDKGTLHFQEYFVKYRTDVSVSGILFEGALSATASPEAKKSMHDSKAIVLGPSNPVTSIGPILSIPFYKDWFRSHSKLVIAVSPIKGSHAFSGPTIQLMNSIGIDPSPVGLAKHYEGLIDILILDENDRLYKDQIQSFNIDPIFTSISLQTMEEKVNLAQFILDLI